MSATIVPLPTRSSRRRYIPELLDVHLEELEFLWGQRRDALHSPRYFLRDFLHLKERLEAHIQGLLAVPDALPEFLLPPLTAAESRDSVFAASCPLLRLANPGLTQQVVERFMQTDATIAPGFRDAFSFAPAGQSAHLLKRILQDGAPLQSAHAAAALANLRALDGGNARLDALLRHDDPGIASLVWQATLAADCLSAAPPPQRPWQGALARPEAKLRDAVLKAAVWTGQPWIAGTLRTLAASGDRVALKWLAITGTRADGVLIVAQAEKLECPEARSGLLARFGHPGVLTVLRDWVARGDPLLSAHAGEAFTRMTGCDVRGERVEAPLDEAADDFAREFADLIWTGDLKKIDAYLRQNGDALKRASRWGQGLALDGVVTGETLAALDLQTRWDQLARNRLLGHSSDQPAPIVD